MSTLSSYELGCVSRIVTLLEVSETEECVVALHHWAFVMEPALRLCHCAICDTYGEGFFPNPNLGF